MEKYSSWRSAETPYSNIDVLNLKQKNILKILLHLFFIPLESGKGCRKRRGVFMEDHIS